MSILILLLYFIIILKLIISNPITECELNSYCGTSKLKLKCSIYGNCNYQIFDFYNNMSELSEYKVVCECNKGYSSFDIEHNISNSDIYCCYSKKSLITSFFLELFLGFGIGHFYLGNIKFAVIKLVIQIVLCVGLGCVTYFSCIREHPYQTNSTEANNNENIGKNNDNDNKNNENKENEIIEEKEENINDNMIDNKNDESKDESFELEENKDIERMFKDFISCPKSKFFIYFSSISFFLYNFIDALLIAFGVFKDKYGEELYLGA